MKRFKTISSIFIVAIAIIFVGNVYYMVRLYASIRNAVEKNVMTAIADADLDELWFRLESKESTFSMEEAEENYENNFDKNREIFAGLDNTGTMKTETRVNGETVDSQTLRPDPNHSLNNIFSQTIALQIHALVDDFAPADLAVMDSVLTDRLNSRFIYPDYVHVEVVDSMGKVIMNNPEVRSGNFEVFSFCFNPADGLYYRTYITPLTRHILSEMAGVILTVVLLLISFSMAFWYLIHTVSKLRSIEEMKDDFVNNMTHELKTPIAIAYSANDALLNFDTDNDPEKKTKYLKIANRQLIRLRELVENILALSMERRKAMQLKQERILLAPCIEEIASAQRMRKEKEITINVDVDDHVTIISDKSHLSNIFNNLIDNAIKYSGDMVTIDIKGSDETISISDNGIGIPEKSIPFIFNKFYRVPHGNRQDVRGYGIGLYYVKSILDKMGWSISVKSKEGKGTIFTIKLNKDER